MRAGRTYDPHDAYPEGWPEVFHWQVGQWTGTADSVCFAQGSIL